MTPEAILTDVEVFLRAHHDAAFAEGQRRFFQHEVTTSGVRAEDVREVARRVYGAVKGWPVEERDRLMELMWEQDSLEMGGVVCHAYRRFAKSCRGREFRVFTRWVDYYVRNWAHCDGVASWLLAACIENEPNLRFELTRWTGSKNRWKRRASCVALLQEAKAGRHTEFIFDIAESVLADRDDMVEKGVGWLLKETYPKRPKDVVLFLMNRGRAASRLTLRYAAEKMKRDDRVVVLGRT